MYSVLAQDLQITCVNIETTKKNETTCEHTYNNFCLPPFNGGNAPELRAITNP